MKAILSILVLLLSSLFIQAQYEVMKETVTPVDTLRPKIGPNGNRFFHVVFGYHGIVPTEANDLSPVKPLGSQGLRVGWLWKYRISNFLSAGYQLDYNSYSYNFSQTAQKTFPDTLIHQSQRINLSSLGAIVYLRFNFDVRRGNHIGHYFDAGAYAGWNLDRSLQTKDNIEFDQVLRTSVSRLNYVEQYQYGLYGAIGLNKFLIYGRYRISDVLNAPYSSAELPRLSVGIGFCLY